MKKTAKRLLSMALALVMVLSLLPATVVPALAADDDTDSTKDAFGITMAEWTAAEKAEAEANLPFGTGYGAWTTLLEKSELFFSMGYDSATRLTGLFDWNGTEGTTVAAIRDAIGGFGQSKLTSKSESYKAVATAAMDLYGTGKKEYVANLALNTNDGTLSLYVTDSSNNRVAGTRTFINVDHLSSMEVHQLNGAFSIVAGDFDGDGKDTVVVYVPQTDGKKETKNGTSPSIKEYSFTVNGSAVSCTEKSTVSANVLTMLCNNTINVIDTMKNQPMVDLVAEDVDKDGFDELIVTGGMNDVTNSDSNLGSQLFIFDRTSSGWNRSYWSGTESDRQIRINGKRIVWASSSVGNIIVSTSTTSADYPEIITAGFIDNDSGKHINVDGSDDIGVQVVRVKSVQNKTTKNVICEYAEDFNQKLSPNSWTKGGFYESEDVNGLLQVQAYADRGLGSAESVFISGSVYRINSNADGLELKYNHNDFNGKDDFAPGGRTLTNTTVTAVTAGNFDGNDEGREQLICVTTLKQSGKNNAYSRVYCYYNEAACDDNGTWTDAYNSKRSSYLTEHKGNFYVSLATLDTGNDSVIAKLESVERDYSAPDVLAILESAPYFDEIDDSFGNSETTYGKATSSGNGSTNSFGFTLGVSVGYEFESDLIQSGGGFEIAVDNAFNWGTAKTTTVEWFTEFRNDSGENLVVVYRCPVVTYQYVDLNGKELVVEKVGSPATSMITVDEYNEAAEQYDGLDPIDETNAKLGDPGDPASYRSTTQGLDDAIAFNGAGEGKWDNAGWTQYYGTGSVMQGLTVSEEQEDIFSYDLAVSKNVFIKAAGVTAGATYGFTYGYEKTHISGKSVTKSGAVNGQSVSADYDFDWKFAAWNCTLNGGTVPVLGYLVQDVVAPPSPGMGLTAESFTTDSVTLRWSSGIRPADQYRIYRVLNDTDGTHVLVGAVQGDETSFKLTGLKPGETYTYVVRGVGIVAGKAVESVDSSSIIVRTQSEDSTVTLSLCGSSLEGSTLQSTGAAADIQVQVTGEGGGSCSYQWQLLEAGAAGIRHGWLNVGTLAGETIGTVTGATGGSLTLKNIDESLNGSSLRCVVTVTSMAGDRDTYYSPVATLDLSGLDTTTTLRVSGNTGGSGSIAAPYTGMADHTTVTEKPSGSYVYVPATVTDGSGKEYTIYQDADNNAYVGAYDEVDTATDTSSRTYYAVTKTGDTYTLGSALTLDDDQYFTDGGNSFDTTGYTGFDGTVSTHEGNYEKRYVVGSGSPITLAEYWYNISDGQYYTKTESGFALANPQPDKDADGNATDADLRMVYYEAAGTVILSADGDDSYDHYQVYTAGESGYTAGASFYRLPGTTLKNGGTAYADSAKLTTVTVQQEVSSTVTTSVSGTQLTLSASVNPSSGGTVSFTITNTDTGVVTQITAANGTATWTAPKAGLYRIVATAAATTTTKSSSAVCYYRADDPNSSYRLTVKQGGEPVTNIGYNGYPVSLVLEQRINDTWSAVTSGVSYKANDTAFSGSSYTPGAAGSYRFSAVVNGKTVATAVLVVNKVSITVTPTWTGSIPASKNAIGLAVTDAQGNSISVSVAGVMTVSCGLYNSSGALDTSAESGVYTVTPVYVSDAEKATFLSRYSVTLNTGSIYYFSDKIAVHFEAGENGKLSARYIDPSGTEFSFSDGSQISMDYGLKFVAEPNAGWSVEKWTVTAGDQDVTSCFSRYIDTLVITGGKMADLKTAMGSSKTLNVLVTFTNKIHKITYSAGDGGSLSATAGGDALISGASVANNAAVTFTAVPETDKMVEKWTVDGAEYKWDGTNALYRENTLPLENISAAHEIKVFFTSAATTNVSASAVDTNTVPYSAATVTVTDAQGNTLTGDALKSVPQSGALTFTATIDTPSSAVVKEWQTSTDGVTWTTVTGSGGKNAITIYEHGANLHVRVVIAVSQTYKLSWKVMEGGNEITADSIATLTVMSGNDALGGNGSSYAANIPVTFTLWLSDAYEVVGWSSNVTADGNTAALSSLTEDTTVIVAVRKKPTVAINYSVVNESATGGTLSAQVDSNTLATGGSARYDQTVTFTAAPADGYRVKAWTLNGETWTDAGTNAEMTLDLSSYKDKAAADRVVTVTVEFMPIGNQITCSAGENGSIESAKIGNVSYDFTAGFIAQKNAQVVITAAPDTGYEVKAWKVNDEPVEGETGNTFTYTANGTTGAVISVEFQPVKYTVNWSAQNGTVTAEGQTGSSAQIRGGENVTFIAAPGTGYVFDHWTVNGVEPENATAASFAWTVPTGAKADTAYDICAVFVKATVEYTVTYSAGENGTISTPGGENGSVTVASGGSVTFTATPDANYMVKGWKVDGIDVPDSSNQKTFTLENVREDCTVTVEFEAAALMKVDFAVDGDHGTLTAQANETDLTTGKYVSGGSKLVFTAAPAKGYMVKSWTVNGVTQSELSNTLTIDSLTGNVTVKVAFKEGIPLTINCGENGTLTVKRNEENLTTGAALQIGDTLTITAAPANGYQLSSLPVNDTTISSGDSYTVTVDDTALTIAAAFTKSTTPSGGGGSGGSSGGGGGGAAAPAETVIIKDSVNGKVTADNTYAKEGNTVTLTVKPDKGYTLETLIVTNKNGDELKLKDNGDGKYTFTMPASNVTVKATFMEDNSMLNFFVDVPADAYYYDAVLWAAKEGITGGTDATHFSPNVICTRAQAVTFLWRAAGSPAPESSEMPFADIAADAYYHDAVLWAVEQGITKGTSETTFSPDDKCTRAQIVSFLWRSQKSPAAGSVNPFTDVAADAYYANAVLWAVENGITAGTTATTFSPNNDCTRAQIVTFLYRCMK